MMRLSLLNETQVMLIFVGELVMVDFLSLKNTVVTRYNYCFPNFTYKTDIQIKLHLRIEILTVTQIVILFKILDYARDSNGHHTYIYLIS